MKRLSLLGASIIIPLILLSCTGRIDNDTVSFIRDPGRIEVYFCPKEKCSSIFIEFINNSGEIDCALFDAGEEVADALLKKDRARVVVDDSAKAKFKGMKALAVREGFGLMHNKFCVSGNLTLTGSTNPTERGLNRNKNNIVIIESAGIASLYRKEFFELYRGEDDKTPTPQSRFLIGDSEVEVLFCPEDFCAEKVSDEILRSKESVRFMTFSFTHPKIANALILQMGRNISVEGIMESSQVSKYSYYDLFIYHGMNLIKDRDKANMHHKVFIIDNSTVITGSFNPTKSGDRRNDENIVIIRDSRIAELFLQEFYSLIYAV